MGKENLVRSHSSLYFFSTLASFVNIFLPILLVRMYPANDIGIFKIYFLYCVNIPLFTFASGLHSGLPLWASKKENGRIFLQQAFSLNLFIAFCFLILGLIAYYPLHTFALDSQYYFSFLFGSFFYILTLYFDELFIATGRVNLGGIFLASFEIMRALTFLFLGFKQVPLSNLFYAYVFFVFLKFLTGLWLLRNDGLNHLVWIESVKKSILSFSIPVGFSNFLGFFLEKSDQFILSFFATKEMFAYYGTGCLLIPPLLLIEQSATRVSLPQLSESFHELSENPTHRERIKEIYQHIVQDIALLNIPGAFGLLIFADPIVTFLFGPSYTPSIIFLRLFSFYYLTLILPPDILLRAKGDGKTILKLNMIFAPISVLACLLLSFYYQAYGALIAFLLVRPVRTLVFLKYSIASLNMRTLQLLPTKTLSRYFIISAVLSVLSLSAKSLFQQEFMWFITAGGLFFVSYVIINFTHFKRLLKK